MYRGRVMHDEKSIVNSETAGCSLRLPTPDPNVVFDQGDQIVFGNGPRIQLQRMDVCG